MSHFTPEYHEVEVVGFDLDNTLYPRTSDMDSLIQSYIYQHIGAELGVDVPAAEALFHEHYKHGQGLSGSASLRAIGVSAEGIVQDALENADIASVLEADPYTTQLLQAIAEVYRSVDLLTGSARVQTTRKLGALAIDPTLFGHIICGDSASKGSGEAYELWLGHYPDLRPQDFLYVGDSRHLDHEIPAEMGIATILVNIKEADETLLCPQLTTIHEIRKLLL